MERVRGQSGADDRSLVRLADPPLQRGARRPQQQPLRHSHHDADGGEEDACVLNPPTSGREDGVVAAYSESTA